MTKPSSHPLSILLVDDNRELIEVLAEALQMLGNFRVSTAENGAIALERIARERPDCVVVDVVMPELDGFQFVRTMRGDPRSANTPLVILTAMAQDKDRFAGFASGADQYLIKPTKPLDLITAIETAIRQSSADRQARLRSLADHHFPL